MTTFTQLPAPASFVWYLGDDRSFRITIWTRTAGGDRIPYDLTGATIRSQIRKTAEEVDVAGTFVITTDQPGVIWLHLPADVSADLPARSVYDVELITVEGWTITLAAGTITLITDVTR